MAVLVIATVIVLAGRGEKEGVSFDRNRFTIGENTVITTVDLEGPGIHNRFEYLNGKWIVNDRFLMDDGMRDVFFALLSRVEVKRPAPINSRDSLVSAILSKGIRVSILNNMDTIMQYQVAGNEDEFESYFLAENDDQPYLMHIPGYQTYITGIFSASENDWRSRYIWEIDWTSLKRLEVKLQDSSPLVFEFRDNFMSVEGVQQLDTAAMMSYLENIAFLQTDKYLLPDEIPVYTEAIHTTEPLARIDSEQIGDRKSSLVLYRNPEGKKYIPGLLNENQIVLFQTGIMDLIKADISDFERSDK